MALATQKKNLSCWIITEGMIGTENQCLGVTDALGITPKIIQLKLKQPWKSLTPWLGFEQKNIFDPQLLPPFPDLLITAGRKAIAASRYIKKQSGGKTLTVHIQDPKCSPKDFDLVAVPFHDSLRGQNVLVTDGAPNRITPSSLQKSKLGFVAFEHLPSPRIAVLIGGNSRTHKLTPDLTRALVEKLKQLHGSLMITTSRRTGEGNERILRSQLTPPPLREGDRGMVLENNNNIEHPHLNPPPQGGGNLSVFFWDGNPPNPYHGMLAWADYILVTEDSVSMISDACSTGKPVFTIKLEGGSKRFDKFHNRLKDIGAIKPFDGNLTPFSTEPLTESIKIAMEIKTRLGIK